MDQNIAYGFFDTLFLRAPYYSFEDYALDRMPLILTQQEFRNALWLASPDFYNILEKKNFDWLLFDKKEQFSLYKYYNRMSFRPTPFGAFSSFSLVKWTESDHIRLAAAQDAVLHLLPSRKWQEQVELASLNTETAYLLRTNPTLFRVGNNYRMIRSITSPSGKIKFNVNEIKAEPLNVQLTGQYRKIAVRRDEISRQIEALTGCSSGEAQAYLDFLIREQVLLSEYQGNLIIKGYWETYPCGKPQEISAPGSTEVSWQKLSALPLSEKVSLPVLATTIKTIHLPQSFDSNKSIFYGGLQRKVESGGLSPEMRQELLAAITLLRRIVIPYPTPALQDFKKAFKLKFEGQRIPLLQALDPDMGISYGSLHKAAEHNGLLEDLVFPSNSTPSKQLDWTSVHLLFLRIWIQNTHRSTYEPIILDTDALSGLDDLTGGEQLPPSLAVMFFRAGNKLILDNSGGASALSMIGRFSSFSPRAEVLCREIVSEESTINPDVIFAEVHQLSDTHVDNINRRTPLYDHVINLNTFPPETRQVEIAPDDLMVFVRGEELWLESISLGKRVIPRLPTAYNFHHNELAVFQMLCDLQFQGLQANFTFDLEKLFPGLDFYPRVEYSNSVISLARWRLSAPEVSALLIKPLSIGRLHQFRQSRGIPGTITMGLSDQQLTFNLVNDDEALFFLDCLREHSTVILREFIRSDRKVTASEQALTGQFIALLKNPQQVYKGLPENDSHRTIEVKRNFPPGSGWLYIKIYCTAASADRLLIKLIAPFLKAHSNVIGSWFFIRYQDPEPHIRLRLKCESTDSVQLLAALHKKLAQKSYRELIRGTITETYQREIERYTAELMELAEAFFCAGSEWVLADLQYQKSQPGVTSGLMPFLVVFVLAADFFTTREEMILFFKWRSESFLKEFGSEKQLKVNLDSKYRQLSKALRAVLDPASSGLRPAATAKPLTKLKQQMALLAAGSAAWPAERRHILLADLIHMQVNRMFSSMQRQHEALICNCLYKYVVSEGARKNNGQSV